MRLTSSRALAVVFAAAAAAPSALTAQYRAAQVVAATAPRRTIDADWPTRASRDSARVPVHSDSASRRLSLGRHLLVGAGVGAAVGLAIGVGIYVANRSSECDGCLPPLSASPPLGLVAGAAVGTLVGWVVYVGRSNAARGR